MSCHSAHARRAERVCHASVPWQQRMRRDSSPDPERTWPGAIRSTSTTSQPASAQWRATDAPKTPAPTTTSDRSPVTAGRLAARAPGAAPQRTLKDFEVATELLYGATLAYLTCTRQVPLRLSFWRKVKGLLAGLRPPWIVFHLPLRFCCQ
jgi:hypothetical protein